MQQSLVSVPSYLIYVLSYMYVWINVFRIYHLSFFNIMVQSHSSFVGTMYEPSIAHTQFDSFIIQIFGAIQLPPNNTNHKRDKIKLTNQQQKLDTTMMWAAVVCVWKTIIDAIQNTFFWIVSSISNIIHEHEVTNVYDVHQFMAAAANITYIWFFSACFYSVFQCIHSFINQHRIWLSKSNEMGTFFVYTFFDFA